MSITKIPILHEPSILHYLKNPFFELNDFLRVSSFHKRIKPQKLGDGHPIVILPGHVNGKRSINRLQKFLIKNNYPTQTWQLEKEVANAKNFYRLSEKIENLFQKTNQPITLIGWSLGGLYVRLLAKKHPEKIRQIISINSPFNGVKLKGNAEWLFSMVYGGMKIGDVNKRCVEKLAQPVSVPSTAFYSKDDELVNWQTCMEKVENEKTQNIEIEGSHVAVVFSEKVLPIILDRLQYQNSNWKKYDVTEESWKTEISKKLN